MTPAPSLPPPSVPTSTAGSTTTKFSTNDAASKNKTTSADNDSSSRDFTAVFSKCAPKAKSDKNASASNRGNAANADAESAESDSSSSSSESSDSFESPVADAAAAIMSPLDAVPVVVSPMALWALRFQKQFGGKEPVATATSTDIAPVSSVKANTTTATLGCVTPPVPGPTAFSKFVAQPTPQAVDGAIETTTDTAPAVSNFQPQARPASSAQIAGGFTATLAQSNPVADSKPALLSFDALSSTASPELAVATALLPFPQPPEKLAATASGVPAVSSEQPALIPAGEFLNVEKQQLTKPPVEVGTEVAKPANKMASRSEKFAIEPRASEVAARVAHSSDSASPVGHTKRPVAAANDTGSSSSQSDSKNAASTGADSSFSFADTANTVDPFGASATGSDAFSVPTAVSAVGAPAHASSLASSSGSSHASNERLQEVLGRASDAAGAVREVVDMTHEFRARERSSVEVKFNFKDDTELSVRIAVKAGEVQTTFRTDSAELRSTLGREWQQQLVANASDAARTARLVDPVFTSNSTGQGSTSANGGDAQRQSFSQHEQSAANRGESFANTFNQTGSRGGSTTSARPSVSHRPETVRHLHVFA